MRAKAPYKTSNSGKRAKTRPWAWCDLSIPKSLAFVDVMIPRSLSTSTHHGPSSWSQMVTKPRYGNRAQTRPRIWSDVMKPGCVLRECAVGNRETAGC